MVSVKAASFVNKQAHCQRNCGDQSPLNLTISARKTKILVHNKLCLKCFYPSVTNHIGLPPFIALKLSDGQHLRLPATCSGSC